MSEPRAVVLRDIAELAGAARVRGIEKFFDTPRADAARRYPSEPETRSRR